MIVRLQLSALRQTRWYELVLRIIFGGLATVLTGLIAKSSGPVVAGLFLAFPAIFPATATLVEKHTKERRRKAGLDGSLRAADAVAIEARGATLGSVGLIVFAAVMWLALPHMTSVLGFVTAASAWLALSITVWQLRRMLR
ncbi:MAG TPA: DUF3147 family protein [Candidatus Acidoferrum sp.]|jgi:hypothetical protein|nr:DUF3147 family protein [Candidatus Acidoferrum sp.]